MVIWSGRGILIVLIFFLIGIIFAPLVPKDYWNYVFAFASFVTAAFSWFFGDQWNNEEGRVATDNNTGQKLIIRRKHSLFFIKMQYWGIILSIIGIIILFYTSTIAAIIALICVIGVGFLIYKNKEIQNKTAVMNIKDKKNKITMENNSDRSTSKDIGEEAERLRRRQEKEDPRRFMPKSKPGEIVPSKRSIHMYISTASP